MSAAATPPAGHPVHGQVAYVQIPAVDIARSAAFYQAVFGWTVDPRDGSFASPGLIGQFSVARRPEAGHGPVLWMAVDHLGPVLHGAPSFGAVVAGPPRRDGPQLGCSNWTIPPATASAW